MIRCITSSRFTMSAEILTSISGLAPEEEDDFSDGEWVQDQHPITGQIVNIWVPNETPDDPDTPENERKIDTIRCIARGIIGSGIQATGTNELFGETYVNLDAVRMTTPASVRISKRDRVTNIREAKTGKVVWVDEEYEHGIRPTIFNVMGVTPLFDPWNRHIENFVILERAD